MMPSSINSNKLTKKYFMSLAAGKYLVANVCDHHYRSDFSEEVAQIQFREEQWERIKSIGADGRLCCLFPNWATFRNHARRKQASAKSHGYEHGSLSGQKQ
jgi:hypothetical protein